MVRAYVFVAVVAFYTLIAQSLLVAYEHGPIVTSRRD